MYIFGVTSNLPGAARIRRYSASFIPEEARWIHCGALFVEDGQWQVIDCDYDNGVTERSLQQFIDENMGALNIVATSYPCMTTERLRATIGCPFSKKKFKAFKYGLDIPNWNGLTCGELLALCDNGVICDWAQREPQTIRAVDFQGMAECEGWRLYPVTIDGVKQ